MKKILITGDNLFIKLLSAMTFHNGVTKSLSSAIDVQFIEEGKVQEGELIIYNQNIIHQSPTKTILSFDGVLTGYEKDPQFFTGICDKEESYEDCSLLVVQPDIFESNISKQEFIGLVKKYCKSRHIPVDETGNIIGEGFPLFENFPVDNNSPTPMLLDKNRADMEIYTIMHTDYFPIMYKKERRGRITTFFGKFIAENKIKVFTKEEVYLLGTHTLFA